MKRKQLFEDTYPFTNRQCHACPYVFACNKRQDDKRRIKTKSSNENKIDFKDMVGLIAGFRKRLNEL